MVFSTTLLSWSKLILVNGILEGYTGWTKSHFNILTLNMFFIFVITTMKFKQYKQKAGDLFWKEKVI